MPSKKLIAEHSFNEMEIGAIQLALVSLVRLFEGVPDNGVIKVAKSTYEKIALITGITKESIEEKAKQYENRN